jgi:hypothetical protein
MATAEARRVIADVGAGRPVVPVVWAHHDDGNYVGRPYTPYEDFYDKLIDAKAAGFGIIHWTTRPLDLYFASLSEQAWKSTKNQPLEVTCEEMAQRSFGRANRQVMGRYLRRWVTEAPKIGRETSDRFIDRRLEDPGAVAAGVAERAPLLERAMENTIKTSDVLGAGDRVFYFQGLERFLSNVHRTEAALEEAKTLYESGDLAAARLAMDLCRPGRVIEQYATFSERGGITRGEQGLVVSLNLRWLVHYVRFRQVLGMEAIRYNCAPTSHDPLAQSRGTFTFHFEPVVSGRHVWQCLGTEETGAPTFVIPGDVPVTPSGEEEVSESELEICRTGIETDKPLTIALGPIMSHGGRGETAQASLVPGSYRLDLLFADPESTGEGERVFDIELAKRPTGSETPAGSLATEPVDLRRLCGGPNRAVRLSLAVELPESTPLELTLKPVQGKALLCGVILDRVRP